MTVSPARLPSLRVALRLVALVALVLAATWGAHLVRDALDLRIMPGNEQSVHRAIMLGALAYVGLLAMPFVPGAEIGLAMLAAFGAAIAPLVYGATVLAMMLSYGLGCALPPAALARLLALLRLRLASDLAMRAASLPREERLALLLDGAPPGIAALLLRRRYVALGLAINVPGNGLIGGGGGIMMMAGLSGLFAPVTTLLTVTLAVSPVPVAIMLFGI
ncbi:hypothetical protein [Jannaschia formosa]|uniref:hypothetical protein n=1 Tax=Jannaschia formosa TaxID=2259592 RepID=UPI000E1B8F50|nr:hypothetical protein [Jannaschia formosa]TFL16543.1 hypothetical protein DR046_19260 [Jannaschia formosa]